MQYLKLLKIILQSKKTYFILLLLSTIYTVFYINTNKVDIRNDNEIIGKIISIKKYETKTTYEIKSKDKIIVNYYNTDLSLNLGDKVKIKGQYSELKDNTIFNLFNYKNYLLSKNIKYSFLANNIEKISNNSNLLYKIKTVLNNYIDTFKSKSFIKTFIMGENNIEDIYKDSFQSNGISHLFSISGLHVTLFALILTKLLGLLLKNKKIIYIIIYCFLILYMFLVGFTHSLVRGCLMYILGSLKKLFRINIKTIYILILIFSFYLFINPYVIYNIGFVFSFTISFYLIIFNNLINKYNNYFKKVFMTSLIAFLVSIPICINNFFIINLLTPFINIIFVPIVSVIIFPLAIITLVLKPFDNILFILSNFISNLSLFISKIDIFVINLRCINIYTVLLYYIVITYILYSFCKNKYYKIIYLLIIIFIHYNVNYLDNSILVTNIDVKQGDSTFIKLANNKGNILIDTGGYFNSSIVENSLIPYFKSLGVKQINYLILTHGDYDHLGESINLINNFKVDNVILNCGTYSDLEKELIKVLDKKKIVYYSCIKELNINNYKLYFLNNKDYNDENNNSSVIYTEFNKYKFLFMGDAGVEVETNLIKEYNLSNIDVLKVGHHGSKTSSSENFINIINPKYSVISVGKNNKYGHPHANVLNNLENSKIYRTDIDGSIMFKIKNNKLKIEKCIP